jgi:hypothetical protein
MAFGWLRIGVIRNQQYHGQVLPPSITLSLPRRCAGVGRGADWPRQARRLQAA